MERAMPFLLSVLLAALFLFGVAPARAEAVSMTCAGTEGVNYVPGLTDTPRPINVYAIGVVGPCAGLITAGVQWGSFEVVGGGNLSCAATPASGTLRYRWSDGTISDSVVSTLVIQRPLGQVILIESGVVVAGRFLGATIVRTLTLAQTALLGCSTPTGVTAVAGPVTVTVTALM